MHFFFSLFLARLALAADPPLRDVYVQLSIPKRLFKPENPETLSPAHFAMMVEHPSMEIVGDGVKNGNLRLEVVGPSGRMPAFGPLALDYGTGNPMVPPVSRDTVTSYVRAVKVGSLAIDNKDIFDPATGKGKMTDVWARNTLYNSKTKNCVNFVNDMLAELAVDRGEFDIFWRYYQAGIFEQRSPGIPGDEFPNRPVIGQYYANNERQMVAFDVSDANAPKMVSDAPAFTQDGRPFDTLDDIKAVAGPNPSPDMQTFIERASVDVGHITPQDSAQVGDYAASLCTAPKRRRRSVSSTSLSRLRFAPDNKLRRRAASNCANALDISGRAEIALVRAESKVYTITSVAKSSLKAIGGPVGAAITAAAFVILDLINGQWAAAALGAVGGVVGFAAAFVGGPVGILLGAAISLFFAIIPSLFDVKDPPPTSNPAKIIQWTFFGDTGHTGNEGCNKQRADAGLQQDCVALYGAGTISKLFGWSVFDAIVFLIDKNKGHAMSIKDMAAVMPVKDYTNSGFSEPVYIDCGPPEQIPGPRRPVVSPQIGYPCRKPKYILERSKVKLTTFDQTAEKIYSRIIPAPGGDCKLLSDPVNGLKVPFFDMTVTGRPVAIECNLKEDDVVGVDPSTIASISDNAESTTYSSGTVLVYNPVDGSTALKNVGDVNIQNNTQSTDGSNERGYRTPPPPQPFKLYNLTNSICFTYTNANFCVPNGTYNTFESAGFTTSKSTGLSMPKGAYLAFDYPTMAEEKPGPQNNFNPGGDGQAVRHANYTTSITAGSNSADFEKKIKVLASSSKKFDSIVDSAPGICLYSAAEYKGTMGCWGLGGDNFSDPLGTQAQSLSLVGGAAVWLYSGKYGDLTASYLSTDVPDLSAVADGSELNFAKRIKAMWVGVGI